MLPNRQNCPASAFRNHGQVTEVVREPRKPAEDWKLFPKLITQLILEAGLQAEERLSSTLSNRVGAEFLCTASQLKGQQYNSQTGNTEETSPRKIARTRVNGKAVNNCLAKVDRGARKMSLQSCWSFQAANPPDR